MSDQEGPRRPLPRSVYVRRRIVVGVIAAAIIVVIAIIAWPRGDKGGTPAASDPSSSSQPSGGATAEGPGDGATGDPAADGDACDPTRIAITANTDKQTYAAGETPKISLTLTNNSSKDCVLSVGTDVQVFTITSPSSGGSDEVYWTSTDCQTEATSQNQVLKAGVPISTPPIEWDRHRSSKGSCGTGSAVGGNGASFDLVAKVGDLTSEKKRFYLD